METHGRDAVGRDYFGGRGVLHIDKSAQSAHLRMTLFWRGADGIMHDLGTKAHLVVIVVRSTDDVNYQQLIEVVDKWLGTNEQLPVANTRRPRR